MEKKGEFSTKIGRTLFIVNLYSAEKAKDCLENRIKRTIIKEAMRITDFEESSDSIM